jgi:hypothetical protein
VKFFKTLRAIIIIMSSFFAVMITFVCAIVVTFRSFDLIYSTTVHLVKDLLKSIISAAINLRPGTRKNRLFGLCTCDTFRCLVLIDNASFVLAESGSSAS